MYYPRFQEQQMRRIYLTGEINTKAYRSLSRKLFSAREANEDVDLILNSVGCSPYDAMAIYDLITASKEIIQIDTIATGLVASAATLVLAAGKKRYMTANAWVMVHEDTTDVVEDDKVSDIERKVAHGRRLENQWNELLAKHTKLRADEWTLVNKTETYLTALECQAYGL